MSGAPTPDRITPFPNGEIGIAWSDGHESYYDSHRLRCACNCARCVDEMTGRKVRLTTTVGPELIGGAVTRIGSEVHDGSVRSQLAQLRRRMLQE